MARRSYGGAALSTTITGAINATDLAVTIADATGWPNTSSGECVVTFGRGTASEERALATRSGTTLTFASTAKRGVDGTTATSHASGSAIDHTHSGIDADEANEHVNATTGHGATGAVVGTTNTQTLTNKTLTAPVITDFTNAQHDHGDTDDGGALAAAAVTSVLTGLTNSSYSATLSGTGWAIGNGTITCRYFQLGKLVFAHYLLVWGSTTTYGSAGPTLTLPVTADGALHSTSASFRGFFPLRGATTLVAGGDSSATTAVGTSLHTGATAFEVIFWDVSTSNGAAAAATSSNVFLNAQATGWLELSGWYIAA